MKNNHIISIDIGLLGAISLMSKSKTLIACEPMPVIETWVNKKIRNQYNISEIYVIIKRWISDYEVTEVGMERLRAIPNQSSQTAFSMGGGAMLFKTIFNILNIPVTEIEPSQWQKKVFGDLGINYTSETTKKASIEAAKKLFPGFDFKPTKKSRTFSDGMTDSALIAYYLI